MGFFRKKDNKVYSLEQALKILKMPQYEKYTTVPVGNGFKLVPETEAMICSNNGKRNKFKNKRDSFIKQLSEQYDNVNTVPNYNNYQTARRYQNQSYRNLER